MYFHERGFPDGSECKESVCNAGDSWDVSWPNSWVRKILGGGNGNSLQYSCLGNPIDRGAWGGGVGLQSMALQRIRHDWVTNTFMFQDRNSCEAAVISQKPGTPPKLTQPFFTPSSADPQCLAPLMRPQRLWTILALWQDSICYSTLTPLPDANHVFVLWNYFSAVTQ